MAVADLCCGSGSLGIEALSRGAERCEFVDEDRACLRAARENLEAVAIEREVSFRTMRLDRWRPQGPIDLVLCDPPYGAIDLSFLEHCDGALVVIESDASLEAPPGWMTRVERRYGGTLVSVLEPERSEP